MTKRIRYDFLIEGEHSRQHVDSRRLSESGKNHNIHKSNFLIELPNEILENLFMHVDDSSDLCRLYYVFMDFHQIDKQRVNTNYSEKNMTLLTLMQNELIQRRPTIFESCNESRKTRIANTQNWKTNFPSCINPEKMIKNNTTLITSCMYFTLFTFIHSFYQDPQK